MKRKIIEIYVQDDLDGFEVNVERIVDDEISNHVMKIILEGISNTYGKVDDITYE